jgi:dolichol-phosphate mannosyltransferase
MDDPNTRSEERSTELSVVIPLYNEEENLSELYRRLTLAIEPLGSPYEIVFIDDGSRDATWKIMQDLQESDPRVSVLRLSRNFGHQAAVSAGLDHAVGRCVIVMDGDLQDPPELIPDLVARWQDGYDVVYAIRRERKEGVMMRLAYLVFYRLFKIVSDLEIPLDSGDFGLMDRRVVEALKSMPEKLRFVRGLRSFVGFRQVGLPYDRDARAAGRPKYTLRRLFQLAVEGLLSFSSHPLRLSTYLGFFGLFVAFLLTCWVFVDFMTAKTAPRGWASLIVVVLFMGSVQLLSLGIIGEYLRLIFLESKQRPTYIVGEYRRRVP